FVSPGFAVFINQLAGADAVAVVSVTGHLEHAPVPITKVVASFDAFTRQRRRVGANVVPKPTPIAVNPMSPGPSYQPWCFRKTALQELQPRLPLPLTRSAPWLDHQLVVERAQHPKLPPWVGELSSPKEALAER